MLIVFAIISQKSHATSFRIAFVDAPPYAYLDINGKPKGSLVQRFQEISIALDIEPVFIHLPHRRQIDFIEQGEVDIWAGQKVSQVSSEVSLVSKTPLFSMELQVFWKQGTDSVDKLSDLYGKKLILISSYSYGGHHNKLDENSESVTYAINHEDGFDKLYDGQGQYLLGYKRISQSVIQKFELTGFQKSSLAKYDLYLKLSKDYPNSPAVMAKINQFLSKSKAQN